MKKWLLSHFEKLNHYIEGEMKVGNKMILPTFYLLNYLEKGLLTYASFLCVGGNCSMLECNYIAFRHL